nr:MAG TPA: hypothetical protein [Caudoviricetes sp.]DAP58460.1 MAG TPA: hypothetical protein [Caudoviricetes sp.]
MYPKRDGARRGGGGARKAPPRVRRRETLCVKSAILLW